MVPNNFKINVYDGAKTRATELVPIAGGPPILARVFHFTLQRYEKKRNKVYKNTKKFSLMV